MIGAAVSSACISSCIGVAITPRSAAIVVFASSICRAVVATRRPTSGGRKGSPGTDAALTSNAAIVPSNALVAQRTIRAK